MSTKSNPVTTTTTQATQPWANAQPALNTALQNAEQLFNNDTGYKPYTGAVQAAIPQQTQDALSQTESIARGQGGLLGNAAYQGATDFVNRGGITSGMQTQMDAMQRTANGGDMGVPPELQAMLDNNRADTANRVNAAASASGRFGSGMHSGAMGREITNATAPILYNNFQNQQGRMDQARQGLLGAYTGAATNALGVGANAGTYTSGLYDPAARLSGVGDFYGQRAQTDLDNQKAIYEANQARPWEMVSRLNAIGTGAGQLGGSSAGTSAKPGPTLAQQILGYGSAGLGLLGKFA
jgi:hypothetical protein